MYANFNQSMKFKKQIILFCLIGAFQIPFINLFSQNVPAKPTRQSSLEAFSQGKYEKAYAEFRELLLTYAKDPLYKYYSGVCLVKLNRDPSEAAKLLQDAIQGAGNIKTLPSDGLFYLGRAQQMSGKFSDATESYKLYTGRVGKKISKEMGVPDLLQQCNQKKGQVADSDIKPAETVTINKPDVSIAAVKPQTEEPVAKSAATVITGKENVPADYEKILAEAVDFQSKADSVSAVIENQKKFNYQSSETEKSALKTRILENEKLAASYQSSADQKYREAEILNHKLDSNMVINSTTSKTEVKVVKDTIRKVENVLPKTVDRKPDTTKAIIPPVRRHAEVFSFFEVLAQPATDPKAKLIIDSEVPQGLIYRIQIAVFRNPVTPAFFKGLSPIYGFRITGTDKTIYYAGMFRRSTDAAKALATVKNKGFKDSFIVALSSNKTVSADRAVMMEKDWGNKPFVTLENSFNDAKADTIPPTLAFRVEVARSFKPLKEDILEGLRKAAGNRGLDIITLEDGRIDYLIGNFITFETAAEYSDLLKRNGYKDAQVVAWLGKKEIPVDTARELFDKLK
jgi:hypothetical protein